MQYGRIVDIELKIPPRPPCYSFVEVPIMVYALDSWILDQLVLSWMLMYMICFQFESSRDAEDAIRGRDGYNFDGCRLRVLKVPVTY